MRPTKQFINRKWEQTDIEETGPTKPPVFLNKKGKRLPRYSRQLKRMSFIANYIKIMRFRARNLKKTFRFYCYDQNSLCWPYRFTKKINKMASDNDRDSDSQLIQNDKNKCLQSLFAAIQQRKKLNKDTQ